MVTDTIILFFVTFVSLSSFIGYGLIINKYYFLNSNNEKNIFNKFFLSLIFIIPISFLYFLLIGNFDLINIAFIALGFIFFLKESTIKDLNFNLLITVLFFSGLLISKTHEDFTTYHFQHIKEISDGTIKFGLANLDDRYFYSSIFSYVQALFKFKNLNFIHVPIYLFYLSLIGYLTNEIIRGRQNYLMSIILIVIILKFRRLSEFGYDYIGQFTLIYIFLEFIIKKKENLIINNTKLILIYPVTLLIKISNIYFLPIIAFFLISQKKFKNIFNYKLIILPIVLIFLTLTFNSYLKTGCFNYLFKNTCLDQKNYSWVFEYQNIENTKTLSKNWSRGLYHQTGTKLNEIEYNKNFNWTKNWFVSHFMNKISSYILLIIFVAVLMEFVFKRKKLDNKLNIYLLLGIFISLSFWFLNFPQFRFGFAGITILTVYLFNHFRHHDSHFKKKGILTILILSILYFNIYNIVRISKEFERKDFYQFTNFPFFPQPKLNYIIENNNDFLYERSSKNKNFWRTCYNANLICVNHDKKVHFKKKWRLIFISKF